MQKFRAVSHTDIGISKKTNQDSYGVKVIANNERETLLAILCDGMGGMAKGELASATVIRAFSDWFEIVFPQKGSMWTMQEIKRQWHMLLKDANTKLIEYGKNNRMSLGTTATAILIFPENNFLIGHVGDTRVYRIANKIEQLTEDHTFVAREIRRGNMTAEQAKNDNRRNVLLQCIGVNEHFEPQFVEGQFEEYEGVLLCSDGLRHMVTEDELYAYLKKEKRESEAMMRNALKELVELNMQRQETDNITAILIDLL